MLLALAFSGATAVEMNDEELAKFHELGASLSAGGNPQAFEEFFGYKPIKSATSELLTIRLLSQRLGLSGDEAYQEPRPVEACPDTAGSPEGLFLVHYASTGVHAAFESSVDSDGDGVPDYVESVAMILDSVYAKTIGEMNFRVPPEDSFYPEGIDGRYDVYLADLKSINAGYEFIYGFTQPEVQVGNDPFFTSFLVMDNDYAEIDYYSNRPLDAIRVTAAHEYTHAVHFAYDTYEFEPITSQIRRDHWFEMSAVWMEEQHYDYINDYYFYLPTFFANTHRSLRTSSTVGVLESTYQYAAVVWPLYLSQTYGEDIVRLLWEECATTVGPNIFESGFDNVIKQITIGQDSFWEALSEMFVWAYFTGDRSVPGFGWEEAVNYPMIPSSIVGAALDTTYVQSFSEFPIEYRHDDLDYEFYPDYLGASHIRFRTFRLSSTLTFDFDGVDSIDYGSYLGREIGEISFDWVVRIAKVNFDVTNGRVDLDPALYEDGDSIVIDDIDLYTEIIAVPMPVTSTHTLKIYDKIGYDFDVPETARPLDRSVTFFDPYPNPFVLSDAESAVFRIEQELQHSLELTVFTLAGEKVFEKTVEGGSFVDWNGENEAGKRVASGMYLVHVKVGDESEVFKVAVIE